MKIPQLIIELGKAKEALGDIEVMMRVYDESGGGFTSQAAQGP